MELSESIHCSQPSGYVPFLTGRKRQQQHETAETPITILSPKPIDRDALEENLIEDAFITQQGDHLPVLLPKGRLEKRQIKCIV